MFLVLLISPSTSSSSGCSPDDPLVVGLIATMGLFCMEGEEGIPMCALTSLFCNLEGSFPKGPDPT